MYVNTPGMPDLVHHTVKHFLGAAEREAWDRVPAGAVRANDAWCALARLADQEAQALPPRGRFPLTDWWRPPWFLTVRHAHDAGYRPRYELLLKLVPDPAGARWGPAEKGRRMAEYLGFRLVLERQPAGWQVVTAFYSPAFAGAADLPHHAPALRAFAARQSCPAEGPLGVLGGGPRT